MFNRQRKARQPLRASWGQPGTGVSNTEFIARYHQAVAHEPEYQRLDDKVWQDLHLDQVFDVLDTTQSRVGQQCLYHQLRSPSNSAPDLESFTTLVDFMQVNAEAREQVQLHLQSLNQPDAYFLTDLLSGQALPALPGRALLPWLTISPMLALAGTLLLHPAFSLLLAALLALNLLFHYRSKMHIASALRSFSQLGNLCWTARRLAALPLLATPPTLAHDAASLQPTVQRLAFLQLDNMLQSDAAAPLWLLAQYLKITFLLDLWLYQRSTRVLYQHRAALRRMFEYVGYVDCAVAVASLRQWLPVYCRPTFTAHPGSLHLVEVYHPLVPECVPNNLHLDAQSLLLTGSNMAGKTTFMRTVGLCAVLAQTIGLCPARAYTAPFRRVSTCITLADSLLEGKSYYFEEVATVSCLVEAATTNSDYLFVIDELFKGTNTVERIAAAKAVLRHLCRQNLVVASTHDSELTGLLQDAYTLYHFTETVVGRELVFDYQLKAGPLTTRNALKLLALAGYPAAVVADATATAADLEQQMDSIRQQ